ncbi:MAG: hypothetical protein EOO73_13545 [Myxococcales bacterium]|nr:MAG: hypothetical protein EOO73_13545 [Myxococcales bacterium]
MNRAWSLLLAAGMSACGWPDGHSGEEDLGEVTQNLSGTVLFVTASTTLNAADTAVRNRLQTLGFTVQVKAAASAVTADAAGKALVVVSSTVASADVGSKFKSVATPVLTWESAIYDDMALVPSGATNLGTQTTQTSVTIAAPSHPMAAGLTGTPAVATSSTFSWGKPSASAVKVATLPSDATKTLIFGFESGSALSDGTTAPARRVGLFLEDNTAASLNANGWNLFNQAVTWAVTAPATTSNVRLTVSSVDDFVYVWVNGMRRKVYGVGQNSTDLDVSSWFASGSNSVRIQAVNTGGPASYSVQLKVNGATVINESCFAEPCSALPAGSGIVLDKSFTVNTVGLARQTVNVTGISGGKLYLDDQYTGLTVPTTLSLPQGSYTLGLGVSTASSNGSYYERALTVGGSAASINVSQNAPLNQPNHTKVAILPIRTAIHGPGGFDNTGVLQDWEIPYMQGQTVAARDMLLEPYSYNLTTWDVDLLPTVETTPLRRPGNSESAPDTDLFLSEAGLTSLKNNYDQIIFFYSKFKQDGTAVANAPCCFWAWGQAISFMDHMARGSWATDYPNLFLLHESLHDYESYQIGPLHKYNGIDGTHGAGAHGYVFGEDGEEDFLKYYRFFIRGQVAELKNMRSGTTWPSPAPASGDLFVGVFDVMRRDVNWLAPSFAGAKLSAASSPAPQKIGCALPAPPLPKQ